jgi:uncharacterized protein
VRPNYSQHPRIAVTLVCMAGAAPLAFGLLLYWPRLLLQVSVVGAILLLDSFVLEPNWIEVRRSSIPAPVDRPIRIAHLSDLHTRQIGFRERQLHTLLDREHPDAIVITGDVATPGGTPSHYFRMLRQLHAPLGVWLVEGNWEHWLPFPRGDSLRDSTGVRLLLNDSAQLTGRVWLVGLDDPSVGDPEPARALQSVPPDAWPIALMHAPGYFERIATRFPLALAGHTHGGQIRLPFWTPYRPRGSGRFVDGWYASGKSRLYVSRGIGTSMLPARLFCRPELAIMTLVPEKATRPSP